MITEEEYLNGWVRLKPEPIRPIIKYRAYKHGHFMIASSYDEAKQYSDLIEKFIENEEELIEYTEEMLKWDSKVKSTYNPPICDHKHY